MGKCYFAIVMYVWKQIESEVKYIGGGDWIWNKLDWGLEAPTIRAVKVALRGIILSS